MNVKKWLDEVANIVKSDIEDGDGDIYITKYNGDYITRVGMEDSVKFLADRGITGFLTHGVGYSPKDDKWYGWSHRAIYGFTIGSTCEKGNCHYIGSTIKEQEAAAIEFWSDESRIGVHSAGIIEEDGERFFDIRWTYTNNIPNEKLRSTISGCHHHIKPLGRGEWVAKTIEDAKQMAIDFNEGVS